MIKSDIYTITNFINNKIPCVYAKYGDGEYLASIGGRGMYGNCDMTPYTPKLQKAMNESFIYISKLNNSYLGQYHGETFNHWNNFTSFPKKWANYHLFIFYTLKNDLNEEKHNLYKAIKYTSLQKIYICNKEMVDKSKIILNIDNHIIVDSNNWFENNFDTILNNTLNTIKDPHNVLILTSAGMGAKPLIAAIHQKNPNSIILDVGSALDFICTGKATRAYADQQEYNELQQFFNNL